MEPIKNLGFLINEAGRMRDLFKAFGEIDGVLKALQAAQNYPAELDKAILEKKKELDGLYSDRESLSSELRKLSEKKGELASIIGSLDKKVEKALNEAEKKKSFELEKIRKANNDDVEASIKLMDSEIEKHKKIIADSKEDLDFIIKRHKEKIKSLAQEERGYNERIEKAKATLANLRKTLEV